MTSKEVRDMIVGVPMSPKEVLFAHILAAIAGSLEDIREEMVTHMTTGNCPCSKTAKGE